MAITKEERIRRDKLAEQGIRVCYKCGQEKPFNEFRKDKSRAYGVCNKCKSCEKQYYQENRKRIKQYNQKNKEKKKEYDKQRYQKPEVKERINKRCKERRQSDPMFKLYWSMRGLVKYGFNRRGWSKDSSTQEIIGCSWEQVVLWLGGEPSEELHIDHVIPQSLAETFDEVKLLNHYTNFQLLPAEENRSKSNRYIRKHNLKRVLAHHPQPDKLKEIVERSGIELI